MAILAVAAMSNITMFKKASRFLLFDPASWRVENYTTFYF